MARGPGSTCSSADKGVERWTAETETKPLFFFCFFLPATTLCSGGLIKQSTGPLDGPNADILARLLSPANVTAWIAGINKQKNK